MDDATYPNAVYTKYKPQTIPDSNYIVINDKSLCTDNKFHTPNAWKPYTMSELKSKIVKYNPANGGELYIATSGTSDELKYAEVGKEKYLCVNNARTDVQISLCTRPKAASMPGDWKSLKIDGKTAYKDPHNRVFYWDETTKLPRYLHITANKIEWIDVPSGPDNNIVATDNCKIKYAWSNYITCEACTTNANWWVETKNENMPPRFSYAPGAGLDITPGKNLKFKMQGEWFNNHSDTWVEAGGSKWRYLLHANPSGTWCLTANESGTAFYIDPYGHVFAEDDKGYERMLYCRGNGKDDIAASTNLQHYYNSSTMFIIECISTTDRGTVRADHCIRSLKDKSLILGAPDTRNGPGKNKETPPKEAVFCIDARDGDYANGTYGFWDLLQA